MSDRLAAAVGAACGARVAGWAHARGGDINRAVRMTLADGRHLFVKHREDAPAGMYAAEAAGLAWIAEAGALRVPAVAAVGEGAEPPFLALEWIEPGRPGPGHDEALGRGLAALHRAGAPAFGLERDNWIGTLPQANGPLADWPRFYGERRLLPLGRAAGERGLLPPEAVRRVEALVGRLGELCGPPEPPSRLHGDLWGGNAMTAADGAPVLVDPAAYGGHREVDLAMMRLFGGFSERVFAAYAEAHPLADGHEERVELYQLYPLLVHVLLFGGAYVRSAQRALRAYD